MADLNDLDYPSLTDMNQDEAIELLRQIRLKRRTPEKTTRTITKAKQPKVKETDLAPDLAASLLALLEESP
jgi:hypothetical protein